MTQEPQYQIGDVLFDFGMAYKITDVYKETNNAGQVEDYIRYIPLFKKTGGGLSYTTPVSLLNKTKKRAPVEKVVIDQLMAILSGKMKWKEFVDAEDAKKVLNTNEPLLVADLVKLLWVEQELPERDLPYSKKELLEQALEQLSEEVAVVMGVDLEKAREMLIAELKK